VRKRTFEPSGFIVYNNVPLVKAISEPSGDHEGFASMPGNGMRVVVPLLTSRIVMSGSWP
jgi:hypothetical protein